MVTNVYYMLRRRIETVTEELSASLRDFVQTHFDSVETLRVVLHFVIDRRFSAPADAGR